MTRAAANSTLFPSGALDWPVEAVLPHCSPSCSCQRGIKKKYSRRSRRRKDPEPELHLTVSLPSPTPRFPCTKGWRLSVHEASQECIMLILSNSGAAGGNLGYSAIRRRLRRRRHMRCGSKSAVQKRSKKAYNCAGSTAIIRGQTPDGRSNGGPPGKQLHKKDEEAFVMQCRKNVCILPGLASQVCDPK